MKKQKLSGPDAWNYLATPYTNFVKNLIIHIILREMVMVWMLDFDENSRVLCTGCGAGIEQAEFREKYGWLPQMVCVDIAENMLNEHKNLNTEGGFERICSDSLEAMKQMPSESFDGVYSLNGALLSNEAYMREYFAEVDRILKPGARAWFSFVWKYGAAQLLRAITDEKCLVWPYPVATIRAARKVFGNKEENKAAITFVDFVKNVRIGEEVFLSPAKWMRELEAAGLKILRTQDTKAGPHYNTSRGGRAFTTAFWLKKPEA